MHQPAERAALDLAPAPTLRRRLVFGLAVALTLSSGIARAVLITITSSMMSSGSGAAIPFAGALVTALSLQAASAWLLEAMAAERKRQVAGRLVTMIETAPLVVLENVKLDFVTTVLRSDIPLIAAHEGKVLRGAAAGVAASGALLYLGWIAPKLVVAGLLVMALAFFVAVVVGTVQRRVMMRANEASREWLDLHHTLLRGAKELRLNRQRSNALVYGRLTPKADHFFNLERRVGFLSSMSALVADFLGFSVLGVATIVAYRLEFGRDEIVTFGVVFLYFTMMVGEAVQMVYVARQRPVAEARLGELERKLRESPPEPVKDALLPSKWTTISTEQLQFSRGDDRFHLGPLDVTIHRNTIVFLVGGNGSGKTTFLKLLAGLYAPRDGSLCLGASDIEEDNRSAYRQLFSSVFFDFHLFDGDLSYIAPPLLERANEYLRMLELDGLVQLQSGTFSTVALSQGQKRRLALVNAYLEDREVYLFDEWAADQDPGFKAVFYRRLLPELRARGKTVIAVTHDDRYFDVADQLIKLEDGRLTTDSTEQFMIRLGAVPQAARR